MKAAFSCLALRCATYSEQQLGNQKWWFMKISAQNEEKTRTDQFCARPEMITIWVLAQLHLMDFLCI